MQTFPPTREIIEIDSDSEDLDSSSTEDLISLGGFDDEDSTPIRLRDIANHPDLWAAHIDESTYYVACLAEILEVFPDICHDHVRQLYDAQLQKTTDDDSQRAGITQELILQILDFKNYPKEKDRINELKRKRSDIVNSDEEEAARWNDVDRGPQTNAYFAEARLVLQEEFISIPSKFIDLTLKSAGNFYAAYLALELAEYTYPDTDPPPYITLKVPRKAKTDALFRLDRMEANGYGIPELKKEIQAARKQRKKQETNRQAKKDVEAAEAATDQEHRDNGDILECQCCFDTYPINKITHCDGDEPHFFCLECASRNAKNDIGLSRYALKCMDGSGCNAQFSREQKQRFLDAKAFEALERLQQQTELRLAQLTNLSACPFCEFAAICPPVSIDKEFRCHNPECERITCRLCKLDSHLPLTCQESKKESGINERHVVEEARTLALLRTCPKCQVKILKDDGCNKVVCTCGGMLCDFCGKDISGTGYVHFDGGTGLTGKKCPTYDNFHIRRSKDVEKAEAEAQEKIRRENPSIDVEDLKMNFAEATKSPPSRQAYPQHPALGRHPHLVPPLHNHNHVIPLGMPAPHLQFPGLRNPEHAGRAYPAEHIARIRQDRGFAALERENVMQQLDLYRLHFEQNRPPHFGQHVAEEVLRSFEPGQDHRNAEAQAEQRELLRRRHNAMLQFQRPPHQEPMMERVNPVVHAAQPETFLHDVQRRRHPQPAEQHQRRERQKDRPELEAMQNPNGAGRQALEAQTDFHDRLRDAQMTAVQHRHAHMVRNQRPQELLPVDEFLHWLDDADDEGTFDVPHRPVAARRRKRNDPGPARRETH